MAISSPQQGLKASSSWAPPLAHMMSLSSGGPPDICSKGYASILLVLILKNLYLYLFLE